jgi:hypothetical protein
MYIKNLGFSLFAAALLIFLCAREAGAQQLGPDSEMKREMTAKEELKQQLEPYIKSRVIVGVGLDFSGPPPAVLVVEAERGIYSAGPPVITDFKKTEEVVPRTFQGYPVKVQLVEIADTKEGTLIQQSGPLPIRNSSSKETISKSSTQHP